MISGPVISVFYQRCSASKGPNLYQFWYTMATKNGVPTTKSTTKYSTALNNAMMEKDVQDTKPRNYKERISSITKKRINAAPFTDRSHY